MKLLRPLAPVLALPLLAQGSSRPLPSVEILVEKIRTRQAGLQALVESYTYNEHTVTRELGAEGQVVKEESQDHEITRAKGHTFRRLILKNGKPLTEKETAQEEARIQKEAERILGDEPSGDAKKLNALNIMRFAEMTTLAREPFRGAERLVLNFRPSRGARPKGAAEEMASRLEGRIYLDEATCDVVHFDARMTAPYKVLGGLVGSISEGSSFSMDMATVNGEVPLPALFQARLAARQFFSHKTLEMETRFTEYRKSSIGGDGISDVQTLPPPAP